MDQGQPQQVQAGAIKKSNYFEREASEIDTKIEKDEEESYGGKGCFFARTSLRTSRKWKVKKIFLQDIWTFGATSLCSGQNFRGLDVKTDAR